MPFFNQEISDKIRDLESPLNERVSFEEVMRRREKKKRRALLFWPRIVVVAGLFTAAGLGYYAWGSFHNKTKTSVVLASNKKQEILPEKLQSFDQGAEKSTKSDNHQFQKNPKNNKIQLVQHPTSDMPENLSPEVNHALMVSQHSETAEAKRNKSIASQESLSQVSPIPTNSVATKIEQPTSELPPQIANSAEALDLEKIAEATVPTDNQSDMAVLKNVSSIDEQTVDLQSDEQTSYRVNIDRLMELSAGKGLTLFHIPDPLSESDFQAIFVDVDGEELSQYFKPGNFNSPYHIELSVATGSRVLMNFDETLPLSILGSQYNAHYQLSALKDMSNGIQLGLGVQYGEWIGNGQWQKREWNSYTVRDSSVLIGFPNPNDRQVIYFDSVVNELTTTQGGISYQINKFSIPIGFRKLMYLGKTPFRFAMQLAPGRTVKTTGFYFSDFEYHTIANQRLTTMDLKLAFGPSINISRSFTIILEPNANLQTFHDSRTGNFYSKSFWGFGFSLIRHIN